MFLAHLVLQNARVLEGKQRMNARRTEYQGRDVPEDFEDGIGLG